MKLLERESPLRQLDAAWLDAGRGQGRLVVVSGDAGIGKTTLVETFTAAHRHDARVLWGACDSLFTPRPLGPLRDIALVLRGEVQWLLDADASRAAIFTELLAAIQARPAIVVFEDVHWADEATLDFLKFLGRRLARMKALVLLTHREDEVGPEHPLRATLGDIPAHGVERLRLAPLSESAVSALAAASGRSSPDLYAITGGNPFYVTELLRHQNEHVPATVQDSILARAARLDADARAVLEFTAIVPNAIEDWLLEAVGSLAPASLDACVRTGLVRRRDGRVAFQHELARRAYEEFISPSRRAALHADVLRAVAEREPNAYARLVHHAAAAGDATAVLELAPRAARQAAAVGAHREAAAHYATALGHAQRSTPEVRAELFERRAYECYLTGQIDAAVQAQEEALVLRRQVKSDEKAGDCLRWLSRLSWFQGRRAAAEHYAVEAVRVLEALPPAAPLAMAWSNRAQLHMLADEVEDAVRLGTQAIELAEQLGATEILVHALNNVGTAQWSFGRESCREFLQRSLQLSLQDDLQEHAARAFTNLGAVAVKQREYADGIRFLDDGIAYSVERDLDSWTLYMRAWRARLHFEQGRWDAACEDATAVTRTDRGGVVSRIPALAVLGHVRARRGDPGAGEVLDEAWKLASTTGELQRQAPVLAARAETAWWHGELADVVPDVRAAFELACKHRDPWTTGEMGFWLWRAGELFALPEHAALPYAYQVAGRWCEAEGEWESIGCPYEQALALADGDEEACRSALAIFDRLGATPAAESLRLMMRRQGMEGVPRGPRSTTHENPLGLTVRQMEILGLLVEGLTNQGIAARLFIAPKTVDHHVSAILERLGVHTRQEAAKRAVEQGLVP